MICQHCNATVEDRDRFCPKCGRSVAIPGNEAVASGLPRTPTVVEAPAVDGPRLQYTRVPLQEGGTKYRGLKTAADLLIKSAAVSKIVCYVLAGLGILSTIIWLRGMGALAVLFAVIVGIVVASVGWLTWLITTIHGELMYVIIDVEENLRRRT